MGLAENSAAQASGAVATDPAPSPPGAHLRAGVLATLPLQVGLVPFALVLGALAVPKGLSPLEIGLMSALVFAGGAQFLAVELWREPTPVLLLATMTALVNARHLLMGAAIAPRFDGLATGRVCPALFFMVDETWALTLADARRGRAALLFMIGSGLGLYVSFLFWTVLGAVLGSVVADPRRYGLDFAFIAVFLVLLRGMWQGRPTLAPWIVTALVAALVHRYLPGPWYVPLGTAAGVAVAALQLNADPEPA